MEEKVTHLSAPKLSNAGWKTIRFALISWGRTARLAVIFFSLSLPLLVFLVAYVVIAKWA